MLFLHPSKASDKIPAFVLQHLDGTPQSPWYECYYMHGNANAAVLHSPITPVTSTINGFAVRTWLSIPSVVCNSVRLRGAHNVFTCVTPVGPLLQTLAGYLRCTNTIVAGTRPPACSIMCKGTRVYRVHGQPKVVEAPTLDTVSLVNGCCTSPQVEIIRFSLKSFFLYSGLFLQTKSGRQKGSPEAREQTRGKVKGAPILPLLLEHLLVSPVVVKLQSAHLLHAQEHPTLSMEACTTNPNFISCAHRNEGLSGNSLTNAPPQR